MGGLPAFTNFAEKTNIAEMSRLGLCIAIVLMIGLNIAVISAQEHLLVKKGTTPKSGVTLKGVAQKTPIRNQVVSLNWVSFEEAVELNKKEKKKILLDVFTYWCGWCKKMDAETFSNPYLAKYLNDNYYLVKLDAESKEPIEYKGKEYRFIRNSKGGHHELAEELLRGHLSFPSLVFLDENMEMIQPIPGYRDAEELLMISSYFGTSKYKEIPWSIFQKEYKAPEGFKR
jgi:thioredoxin-related protein